MLGIHEVKYGVWIRENFQNLDKLKNLFYDCNFREGRWIKKDRICDIEFHGSTD